jgi:hypothetical protein
LEEGGMKTIQRIAAILVLMIGLGVGIRYCFSQIPNGIPANIEPDRVRPLAKIDLPKVEISPDYVEYFLEPAASDIKPRQNYPLVHLRIPKKPHFPANTKSEPIRTFGQTLDMIWPDLAGLGEPGGAACLQRYRDGVGGHCPNLVRVYIDFRNDEQQSEQENSVIGLDRDIQIGYVKPIDEKSKIESLELVGITSSPYQSNRDKVYSSHSLMKKRDLIIRCAEYAVSPACETRFTANKSSNIAIKILFVHSQLPQWQQIIEAVQAKVGSYIIQTYSIPTKE